MLKRYSSVRPALAALKLNLIGNAMNWDILLKQEQKMHLPGRYVDVRALLPPCFKRRSRTRGFQYGLALEQFLIGPIAEYLFRESGFTCEYRQH